MIKLRFSLIHFIRFNLRWNIRVISVPILNDVDIITRKKEGVQKVLFYRKVRKVVAKIAKLKHCISYLCVLCEIS